MKGRNVEIEEGSFGNLSENERTNMLTKMEGSLESMVAAMVAVALQAGMMLEESNGNGKLNN